MKNKFLQEMQDRGYLNQCTDLEKLDDLLSKKSIKVCLILLLFILLFVNQIRGNYLLK